MLVEVDDVMLEELLRDDKPRSSRITLPRLADALPKSAPATPSRQSRTSKQAQPRVHPRPRHGFD